MTNEQLVHKIKSGENVAENMLHLYNQNKGILYQIAKKYSCYSELDDLMQEGYLALYEAVEGYNEEKGALFVTYAWNIIRQKMKRYVDNNCNLIRVSETAKNDIIKYKEIIEEYTEKYGGMPGNEEIKVLLCVNQEKLQRIKKYAQMEQIRSLDAPICEDNKTILASIIPGESFENDLERKIDHEIMQKALWKVVDDLPEEQAVVIRMRYQEHMTLDAVGQSMGVSRERARQEESKAFRKLRLPHKSKAYKDYFEQYISASPIYHVGVSKFSSTWTSATEELALRRYRRTFENDTEMILEKLR